MTRAQVLAARLLAGLAVSFGVVSACAILVSVGALMLVRPHAGAIGAAVAFSPHLLERSPLVWIGVVVVVYTVACSAMLAASDLVGIFASPLVASIAPPLLVLVLGFLLVGPLWSLNPLERISFLQIHGARWNAPLPMLAYWLSVLAAVSALAIPAFARKEV